MNLTENGSSSCPWQDKWGGLDFFLVILHLLDKDIGFILNEVQTGFAGNQMKWLDYL